MYSPPEIRELGQVVSQTLGSSRIIPTTVKTNNTTPDFFTATTGERGEPCSSPTPIGNIPC
jgi:hypothetical protein